MKAQNKLHSENSSEGESIKQLISNPTTEP